MEVVTEGTRDGQPFRATHLFLTSLRTTPETLLRLVRDRWSLEGWHWITTGTQLQEDAHRYRGNGAGALAGLRTAALNLLRLDGFQSVRSGLQAVCHDITALLALAGRQPEVNTCRYFESALGARASDHVITPFAPQRPTGPRSPVRKYHSAHGAQPHPVPERPLPV